MSYWTPLGIKSHWSSKECILADPDNCPDGVRGSASSAIDRRLGYLDACAPGFNLTLPIGKRINVIHGILAARGLTGTSIAGAVVRP